MNVFVCLLSVSFHVGRCHWSWSSSNYGNLYYVDDDDGVFKNYNFDIQINRFFFVLPTQCICEWRIVPNSSIEYFLIIKYENFDFLSFFVVVKTMIWFDSKQIKCILEFRVVIFLEFWNEKWECMIFNFEWTRPIQFKFYVNKNGKRRKWKRMHFFWCVVHIESKRKEEMELNFWVMSI